MRMVDRMLTNRPSIPILPVTNLERARRLAEGLAHVPGVTIDLDAQSVHTSDGQHAYRFHVELFRKQCLLHGHDDIALTLAHADEIRAFETKRLAEQPWLA